MAVQLNDNGGPVAWGEKIAGEDIPHPPDELVETRDKRPKWDYENEEWIEDPEFTPQKRPEPVDRSKISDDTKQKIINARDEGDYETALNHVLDVLDVVDLDK